MSGGAAAAAAFKSKFLVEPERWPLVLRLTSPRRLSPPGLAAPVTVSSHCQVRMTRDTGTMMPLALGYRDGARSDGTIISDSSR